MVGKLTMNVSLTWRSMLRVWFACHVLTYGCWLMSRVAMKVGKEHVVVDLCPTLAWPDNLED